MAIPKRRKSSSARDKRRSHLHLDKKQLVVCSHCGKKTIPHNACKACGYYGDKMVNDIAKRAAKKDKKAKKELKKREKEEAKAKKETTPEVVPTDDNPAKKVQV